MLPNVKFIALEAENILETKVNLTNLKNLEHINFIVLASGEFEGEILNDEDVDEELNFELQLEDE